MYLLSRIISSQLLFQQVVLAADGDILCLSLVLCRPPLDCGKVTNFELLSTHHKCSQVLRLHAKLFRITALLCLINTSFEL